MLRPVPALQNSKRRPSTAVAALALAVLVLGIVGSGCRCLKGPVNASPALRWWLFANFGASKICPELTKSGVGLKLQDRGPSVGRFFPGACTVETSGEHQTVTVNFIGNGYAYTLASKRIGFEARASIEYRPDFRMADNDIYVWGRVNRILSGPSFQLGYVENPAANLATAVTPLGGVANVFGQQIVAGELTRGFTALQDYDTDSKIFTLGIMEPPLKPHTPYQLGDDEVYTFANETIEVQWNQRDFLGPFEVVDSDQELRMKMFLNGPSVEAMVVHRSVGDRWRMDYQQGRPLGPPPGPVAGGAVLQPGRETKSGWRLPPGQYYVVIDHTAYAGQVNPAPVSPLNPVGGPVARISYVASLFEY